MKLETRNSKIETRETNWKPRSVPLGGITAGSCSVQELWMRNIAKGATAMRACFLVFFLFFSAQVAAAQAVQNSSDEWQYMMMTGNELYAACQEWKKGFVVTNGGRILPKPNSAANSLQAGLCLGYVRGILDSMHPDDDFRPDPSVGIGQYIDVVLAYLRDHPNSRRISATLASRVALSQAFPEKAR